VVAGTHGKTTTTSLTGWLLTSGQLDPTVLVGGIALNFGDEGSSYRVGSGRDFVIEGDEYDSAFFDKTAKFLKYLPDIAIINNVEFDHADIYADLDAVLLAFRRLVNLVPRNGLLLIGADSPHAAALAKHAVSPLETFGTSDDAVWQATDIESADGLTHFKLRRRGEPFGRFASPLLGVHNVRNAVAAIAVGSYVGLTPGDLADGLRVFKGIKRRLEIVGNADGVTVIDDFAHHPTAIRETIDAVRQKYKGRRIVAVYEPRSYTAQRREFQDEYAKAFRGADEIVFASLYRPDRYTKETALDLQLLVRELAASGKGAKELKNADAIVLDLSPRLKERDVVLIMSNGGFGGIHQKLLDALATE